MDDLYKFVGEKIRELRIAHHGGINQDELAKELGTKANTISRWESATYKPSIQELHRLAKFFAVSIAYFFPDIPDPKVQALMSATGNLAQEDMDELIEYARFRHARRKLNDAAKRKKQ
jgi:transcriptional regulator with XRE-family HTH domain